jgi:hypothetical protein
MNSLAGLHDLEDEGTTILQNIYELTLHNIPEDSDIYKQGPSIQHSHTIIVLATRNQCITTPQSKLCLFSSVYRSNWFFSFVIYIYRYH